ncbi:ABC transporter substrate-binding protein [Kineococcus sp. R8]|uniref:ABC transporter substrate-binding protein n=1 Tax=Kineococcus siccus TaxID=2696567 RepID=UPI001413776A|nr:ABC transporter substrate-binding protein [Kineococcus siccus]NAZ84150.1 ABC transporter substrate-binding protein [Kineococcus siccus]
MSPRARTSVLAIAALSATALVLSGCTSGNDAGEDDGKLTMFSPQGPGQDLNTNSYTLEVEKQFGVDLEFQTTSLDPAGAAEKRQISLASGDYPDAYALIPWVESFSQAELLRLSKQGVVVPLNDLIEQHAPNIKAAFESTPELKTLATAPDGNVYGLPQWNDCYHCSYGAKLWMNSAWLDKLGLQQPTTPEEMRAVLTAFKTQDPNGNGQADEVPLSGSTMDYLLPFFMNAFIYDPAANSAYPSTLALNGGKVQQQAVQDGWRAGLEYMSSLYADGLIDQGAFTQNTDALNALGDNAGANILGAATVLHPAIAFTLGQEDGRDRQYDAVPPLTGPGGTSYASYTQPSTPGATFVLTNKASEADRIAAIKIMDNMYPAENHVRAEFGKEGIGWKKPVAGDVALDTNEEPLYNTIPAPSGENPPNDAWGSMAQYFSNAAFRGAQVQPTDIYEATGYERRLFDATKLYDGKEPQEQVFPSWSVWIDPAEAGEFAELKTNIENYVSQNSAQFVTGQKDPSDDAQWTAYVEGLEALGLPRYLELQQAGYDKVE